MLNWPHRPSIVILLVVAFLLTALPSQLVVAQDAPIDDTTASANVCDGSTTADYNGPCGPSFTVPNWGDASGWNNEIYADSIQLYDLGGDGKDELIGRSPAGLLVYSWSVEWGQWVPASDLSKPLPYPDSEGWNLPDQGTTISFGRLQGGANGYGSIGRSSAGLQVWFWHPGNGAPGSGFWTKAQQSDIFPNASLDGKWTEPSYYSTIQMGDVNGDGWDEVIGRAQDGITTCYWDTTQQSLLCPWIYGPFSDFYVNQGESDSAQYYETIQLADSDPSTPGLELSGRTVTDNGTLDVYRWDQGSGAGWVQWDINGQAPFADKAGLTNWALSSSYATIQWGQIFEDPKAVVTGRGFGGLVWYTVETTAAGCGSLAVPCWKDLSVGGIFPTPLFWGDPSSYETIQLADVNGDGVDEAIGRQHAFQGQLTSGMNTWFPPKLPGWPSLQATESNLNDEALDDPSMASTPGWTRVDGPALTGGPTDDPLWTQPSYYRTIQTGDIDGDGRAELLARGKYGIRTWKFDTASNSWERPLPYGFTGFSETSEQAAFDLLNRYLNIESGHTIRDSYTSLNTQVAENYVTCLGISINSGATMPPTQTCDLTPPVTALANPDKVTAAEWKNMVEFIQQEVALSNDSNGHFNQSIAGILNDLFVYDQATFDQIQQALFRQTYNDNSITAILTKLFVGLGTAIADLADPELEVVIDSIGAAIMAVSALQTQSGSTLDIKVAEVRTELATLAAAANSRNNDFFQYVAQDFGLLHLVGTLVSSQYWLITGDAHDKAIDANELHTGTWMYQTVLPSIWTMTQYSCSNLAKNGGDCPADDNLSELLVGVLDQQYQARVVSQGIVDLNSDNPIIQKLFQPIQESCQIGPGHNGTWSYQDCNLGINRFTFFLMEDGWTFTCTQGVNKCVLDQEFHHFQE